MKIKTFIYLFISFELCFSLTCCQNKSDKINTTYIYQTDRNILGEITVTPKAKTLMYQLKNNSKNIFYIPKNSWFYCSGDTLYAEALHKNKDKSDKGIMYNQFNPPIMEEFRPKSSIIRSINYQNFTTKVPIFFAIRIYNKRYI